MELYQHPTVYDEIYGAFAEDIAWYVEVARRSRGPVCELACGTGRVTRPLAAALGTDRAIVAIDASSAMIERAQSLAAAEGGPAATIDFRTGDMREPPTVDGGWGTVIVALHSLSHLESTADLRLALSAIARSLAPDGRLAFAIHNPDVVQLAREPSGVSRVLEDQTELSLYESGTWDSARQVLALRWYLSRPAGTELIEYNLRMIFAEELLLLLEGAELVVEERVGWYDGTPFSSESGTQVVVARRA